MRYKSNLIEEMRKTYNRFMNKYDRDPTDASDYFRRRILEPSIDKNIKEFPPALGLLFFDLRTIARLNKEDYSLTQMAAISDALSLFKKGDKLTLTDVLITCEDKMKKSGLVWV